MFGRKSSEVEEVASVTELETAVAKEPEPVKQYDSIISGAMDESDREIIRTSLFSAIDPGVALRTPRDKLKMEVEQMVGQIANDRRLQLNQQEQVSIAAELLDDMIGVGPIEPLLVDPDVSDILVNGPDKIYVERRGKLELTGLRFRDDAHVLNVAQRVAASVGRRIDESSPMVDARLSDGSRVNVIIPPLAIDGASISIRRFTNQGATLEWMAQHGNLSANLARVLSIAGASRLNVLISGGTGSGKTTLLNAMSRNIADDERVITIEDAAELALQQPHVVRLETRPPNLEGTGEITQRDLVKNALRMRPDRIIIGEVRGGEAFDMLQAMNTGHAGSMSTIHANSTRDALARLENMVLMGSVNLPSKAIRTQIVSALDLIVQTERMRDGQRRIIEVDEVIGMEGEVVIMQELFRFEADGVSREGIIQGRFESSGVRPHFTPRAEMYGFDETLKVAMS